MSLRIGVFGGTFNPVHCGHLIMAQDALEEFELDQVLFVPSSIPPHKSHQNLAASEHRVAMLEEAIEGDVRFAVSRIEIERRGVSYTVETLRELRCRLPEGDFFFLIGSDTLPELHTWKEIDELLHICRFITMARPGFRADDVTRQFLNLPDPWPAKLAEQVTTGHQVDISSSDIRMRVAEGLSIRYLVPQGVEMYIYEHQLYRE